MAVAEEHSEPLAIAEPVMRRVVFSCVVFAALLGATPRSAQPYLYLDEPVDARLVALPNAANVSVDAIGAVKEGYKYFECLTFTNGNQKSINTLRFRFMYFDAGKQLVGSDVLRRTGPFAPGAQDKGPVHEMYQEHAADSPFLMEKYKNCLGFKMPSSGIAFIVVALQDAEFADGTSWEAPPDAMPAAAATPKP